MFCIFGSLSFFEKRNHISHISDLKHYTYVQIHYSETPELFYKSRLLCVMYDGKIDNKSSRLYCSSQSLGKIYRRHRINSNSRYNLSYCLDPQSELHNGEYQLSCWRKWITIKQFNHIPSSVIAAFFFSGARCFVNSYLKGLYTSFSFSGSIEVYYSNVLCERTPIVSSLFSMHGRQSRQNKN